MEFTGERYLPTESGRIRLEHYHRYALAVDFVRNKTVLDIACGEGYGSYLLAEGAHEVFGVDIDGQSISHAKSNYLKSNLKYLVGSASKIPFDDHKFDCIVSFETIEHLYEQETMVAELRWVLKPDGVLIISSPNRPVFQKTLVQPVEFHVREITKHDCGIDLLNSAKLFHFQTPFC